MNTFAPEEAGMNLVKISDDTKNAVFGPTYSVMPRGFQMVKIALNKDAGLAWSTSRLLTISPDGTELAYVTGNDKQRNIMTRRAGTGGAATQRTSRFTNSLSWGSDDNLYFSDVLDSQSKLCVIDAHKGTLMRQLTSGSYDSDPVLSADGTKLFFTRSESGQSIWSYDINTGELTNCTRGYNPAIIGDAKDEFVCVRNSGDGNSEIWRVNYVTGQETLILSDKERSYSNPCVSPDGKWLLVVGNSKSSINKTKNLDIFAIHLDGSNFIQLTYHPAIDACPQWSKDGRSIYFLSTRANKEQKYNIWRMSFNLN